MKLFLSSLAISLAALATVNLGAAPSYTLAAAAKSMQQKVAHIEQNGSLAHPDPAPTQLTEPEVNAYFASGQIRLPAGVQSVRFQGEPGRISSTSRVDFDQLKAGQRNSNPLLSLFGGVHDVEVVAHAYGADKVGFVHVDSVALDGVEVPRFVLHLFVQKYLQPRYPKIGLDSSFALPNRIDAAKVGPHTLTLTQR